MSHRNDLNDLIQAAADSETWKDAVVTLHEALQIVGIVLDDFEQRVKALGDGEQRGERSVRRRRIIGLTVGRPGLRGSTQPPA